MGEVQTAVRRPRNIPWWALLLTVALVLFLIAAWNTPVWADSGGGSAPDEVPIWITIAFIVISLIGVQGLVASQRR